ncbi:hypothetical protein KU306_13235 [Haloferax larsenii]|uniref:DUF8173 domain-containing protein n=1 Tax=Haloferax larsenii TaxID=302484 RepID=A0ABY5REI1_HALLR|nr:hypothetical protein [Haloferax larsenii]UVE49868.1 hypothetical protein KU306_13235 [Haloferax larsenii]
MVPPRKSTSIGLTLLGVLALAGVASAQPVESTPQFSPTIQAAGSFIFNLVVGGLLVAAAPKFTRNLIDEIRSDPGESFIWGLLVGIGGLIVLVILAITIIGLLVAIPGFLAFFVLAIVAGGIATVFIGSLVVGMTSSESPSLGLSLVVGALITGVLSAIPFLGGLVLFIANTLGLGVLGRNIYESWS